MDARLAAGTWGGVEQVVIGLAHGLSRLPDGDEDYLFLVHAGEDAFLQPYIGGRCQTIPVPQPKLPRWRQALWKLLPWFPDTFKDQVMKLSLALAIGPAIPRRIDWIVEATRADVMHFPKQDAFLTHVPSIYHPHDLQHLHFPQFFTTRERLKRELNFRTFCRQAAVVAVASRWIKRDIVQQYGLPEDKVQVVAMAPTSEAYPVPSDSDITTVRTELDLAHSFVFYPAQTWPHKNHVGLIRSLAILRDRYGLRVPVVCSGRVTGFHEVIRTEARRAGVLDQVRFVGFVSPMQLQCLYRLSRCVVLPTKFEAGSFPLWEAFLAGVPAACSNVTSLPEQAGDAALLFDPDEPDEIAEAIHRLWTDERLRWDLVERGRKRVSRYSWDVSARIFRAHYRRIAGRALSGEDRELLQAPALW